MSGCVWIVGASSGIGRALALELARRGNKVVASARREEELQKLADEAQGRIAVVPLDVTNEAAISSAIGKIESEVGTIDTMVVAAGTHRPVSAENLRAKDFRDLLEINVMGSVNLLQALLPRMIARRSGQIALMSSVAGYRGLPTAAAYSASKAALIALAESLKFDLDKHDVRMRVINPGFVDTPLTKKNDFPMPFLISPEKAAKIIADGLDGDHFEIVFPKRMAAMMKLVRYLPYRLFFPLVSKQTGK